MKPTARACGICMNKQNAIGFPYPENHSNASRRCPSCKSKLRNPKSQMTSQTLLITGATGIAAETARRAAGRGWRVFVGSLEEDDCRALASEVSKLGGTCETLALDLTGEGNGDRLAAACIDVYGRIDALFNVAGISGRRFGDGPLHECTDEGWASTMNTNVTGMFRVTRAVLRRFLEQEPAGDGGRGAIVNMASVLAFSPSPEHFATHAYAASKGAIVSLTRSAAAYYTPYKIRINAIAPGLVRTLTSQRAGENSEIRDVLRRKQPLSADLMHPAEVADAALFLLGKEARGITGQMLTVDDGWSVSG